MLSLITLQPVHPIVAPDSLLSCLVILSLWIRASSNGNGGIGMGSTRTSGLSTVHVPLCHSPRYSNHAVDGFRVPSALRFQSSDFASSGYTICIPDETFCAVVSVLISGVHPVFRISGDLSCQHFFSKRDKLVCRLLAVQSLKWRPSTRSLRRAPPTMS